MGNVELNGSTVTRENVRDWLASKRVTLWSDWCITDPKRMEIAVDWFMDEMSALSASKGPEPKKVTAKGKKAKNATRSTARS